MFLKEKQREASQEEEDKKILSALGLPTSVEMSFLSFCRSSREEDEKSLVKKVARKTDREVFRVSGVGSSVGPCVDA